MKNSTTTISIKLPTDRVDAYNIEDRVSHNGNDWESASNGNVWEPGVFGWNQL